MVLRFTLILSSALLAALAGACSDGGSAVDKESLEYKLAVVDGGAPVRADDPLMLRFRSLLSSLDPKCQESPERLADMAVAGREMLRDQGIDRSMVALMEFANKSIPAGATVKCAETFALYVSLEGD